MDPFAKLLNENSIGPSSKPESVREWVMEKWSDEQSEYYTSIDFDDTIFTFTFQRDNYLPFIIYINGNSKKEVKGNYKINMKIINQNNQEDLSKTFKLNILQNIDETLEAKYSIKQREMQEKGFVINDQIKVQIKIELISEEQETCQLPGIDKIPFNFNPQIPSIFPENFSFLPIKKPAPYAGLKNQGATCYMNSLLQSLFHIPCFRRLIFEMEEESGKPLTSNVVHNMKLLFANLQFQIENQEAKKAASTTALTKSFGWSFENTIIQHDIQEFSRVLLGNLEDKMKNTKHENQIKQIFGGIYQTYNKGINVEFFNSTNNEFYDLSLQVKDCEDIYQSFDKYIEEEVLSGDNQYKTAKFGLQDSLMGIKFIRFPRVLFIHLKRFELIGSQSIKINSSFKFYKSINLSKYLSNKNDVIEVNDESDDDEDGQDSTDFDLYGVLVHSGQSNSGHFYAYLRPGMNDKWYKFNDSIVTEESENDAIESNFGSENLPFSAYMLIYIKKNEQKKLFEPVDAMSIPPEIIEEYFKLVDEENEENKKIISIEEFESDNVTLSIYNEKSTLIPSSKNNQLSFKLFKEDALKFQLKKSTENSEVYSKVSEIFSIPIEKFELWHFSESNFYDRLESSGNLSFFSIDNINLFLFIDSRIRDEDKSDKIESSSDFDIEFSNKSDFLLDVFNEKQILIFVFAYSPINSPVFAYLFSIKAEGDEKILDLITTQSQLILNRNSNNSKDKIVNLDLKVYHLNNKKLIAIRKSEETLENLDYKNGSIFVIESKTPGFLDLVQSTMKINGYFDAGPKSDKNENEDVIEFNSSNSDDKLFQCVNGESSEKSINFLDVFSENLNASIYYEFLISSQKIDICTINEVKKITFPNSIQYREFCRFLCFVFNKNNFVIMFHKDKVRPIMVNEDDIMHSIISPLDGKLNVMFLDKDCFNEKHEIKINNMFLSLDRIIRLIIDISMNSITKSMTLEFLFPDDYVVSDVCNDLREKGIFPNDDGKLRVLGIKNRRINKIYGNNDLVCYLSSQIRIEKAQFDTNEKKFIKVGFKEINHEPFLLPIEDDNLKISDIKDIIKEKIKISDEEFESFAIKLFFDDGTKRSDFNDEMKLNEFPHHIDEIFFAKKSRNMFLSNNYNKPVQIFN